MFQKGKRITTLFYLDRRHVKQTLLSAKINSKVSIEEIKAAFISSDDLPEFGDFFVCSFCCSIMRSEKALRDHVRFSHKEVIFCKLCELRRIKKEFNSPSGFNKHLRSNHAGEVKDQPLTNYRGSNPRKVKIEEDVPTVARIRDYSHSQLVAILERYCKSEGITLMRADDNLLKVNLRDRPEKNATVEAAVDTMMEVDLPEVNVDNLSPEIIYESDNEQELDFDHPINEVEDVNADRSLPPLVKTPFVDIGWLLDSTALVKGGFTSLQAFRNCESHDDCMAVLKRRMNEDKHDCQTVSLMCNPTTYVRIDKTVFNLWSDVTRNPEIHCTIKETDISVLGVLSNFMYTGQLTGPVCSIIKILQAFPLKSEVMDIIIKEIASVENLEPLKIRWECESLSTGAVSTTLINATIAYIFRNLETALTFHPNGLGLLPKNVLLSLTPDHIERTISQTNCVENSNVSGCNVLSYVDGKAYLNCSHHQLVEYIFRWGMAQSDSQEPTAGLIRDRTKDLLSLVDPTQLNLSAQRNSKCTCGNLNAKAVYYFLLLSDSCNLNEPALLYEERFKTEWLCSYCKSKTKGERTKSGSLENVILNKDCSELLQKLLMDELSNGSQADVTFTTSNGTVKANSFILSHVVPNLLESFGVEIKDVFNPENPKQVKVYSSKEQLLAFLTVVYGGPLDRKHNYFLLYLSTLYNMKWLKTLIFAGLCSSEELLLNPSHAFLLFINNEDDASVQLVSKINEVLRQNLKTLVLSELFFTLPSADKMKILLSLADKMDFKQLTAALHGWCVAQQLINSGMTNCIVNLHNIFVHFLQFVLK